MEAEGFDFNRAMIDPWATTNGLERFFVIVIRTRDGNASLQLIRTDQGQDIAVQIALGQMPMVTAQMIKDISVMALAEMEKLGGSEIAAVIQRIVGEQQ